MPLLKVLGGDLANCFLFLIYTEAIFNKLLCAVLIGQYLTDLNKKMPKIDTLDALDDEMTSILNTL